MLSVKEVMGHLKKFERTLKLLKSLEEEAAFGLRLEKDKVC